MVRYQHRQLAGAVLASLLSAVLGCVVLALIVPLETLWALVLAGSAFLFLAVLFGSLTVTVTEESLAWRFGPGLIRRREPLESLAGAEVTETRFIEGWGIHLTGRGWLYNVSGYGAVMVTRKDGKTFLLGSDEPDLLCDAIRSAMAHGRT
jgi:hypothetical protein